MPRSDSERIKEYPERAIAIAGGGSCEICRAAGVGIFFTITPPLRGPPFFHKEGDGPKGPEFAKAIKEGDGAPYPPGRRTFGISGVKKYLINFVNLVNYQ